MKIDELIAASSIGAGLANIRENGIEAELADLDADLADLEADLAPKKKRKKSTSPTARTLRTPHPMTTSRYRAGRKQAGLSLGQASRRLGIDIVRLSAIEMDHHVAATEAEQRTISAAYMCSVEWLRGDEETD